MAVNFDASLRARAVQILEESYREAYVMSRDVNSLEDGVSIEADSLTSFLSNCDSRTFCILVTSFLEDVLRRTLTEYWSLTSRDAKQDYFGSNGPLSTFSQRVLVCVGVGWLTEDEAKESTRLRKIRNEFAHNHQLHALTDPGLSKLVEGLRAYDKIWLELPEYRASYELLPAEAVLRIRVYCNAFNVARSVLARARRINMGIPPNFRSGDGFDHMTEIEQRLSNHMIRYSFSAVGLTYGG